MEKLNSWEMQALRVRRMRNNYSIIDSNSLIRWMNSSKWTQIPGFMNVRGECVTRYISSKNGAKIVKIVANGMVSGELTPN